MGDPMHFDARAAAYERARPPYPEALWQHLRATGLLHAGVRVLELGAGSGQATVRLVEEGAVVTAVEPGPALAARLRARAPAATVLEATAEAVAVPRSAFDLVVAATSVHWFDLAAVLPKAHGALAPGGRFAVWWNVYGDPSTSTPFRRRIAAIVARRGPEPGRVDADRFDTGR